MLPMLYPSIEEIMQILKEEGVKIVFRLRLEILESLDPSLFLKENGITVVDVGEQFENLDQKPKKQESMEL